MGHRLLAILGLLGIAAILIAVSLLPRSVPLLQRNRRAIKALRARMEGAVFAGDDQVTLQAHGNDCAAAALTMILAAHGIHRSLDDLARELHLTARGTSLLNLRRESTKLGLEGRSWSIGVGDLGYLPLKAIAFVGGDHFVVIQRFVAPDVLEVDDPALGRLFWPVRAFKKAWSGETLVFDPAWTPL
jgi:ABC-type bacteriocin/lantibiotic exporter with double-glycine peptidase domain